MKFTPKSDEEINAGNLLPEGDYNFEVVDAEDAVSKTSGNEMIKLRMRVWDDKGNVHYLFDYLLEAFPMKLKHFAKSTNQLAKYESGQMLSGDCMGKCGKCHVGIEKDKNGVYQDKNAVKDYLCSVELNKPIVGSPLPFDDQIPF